MGRCGGCGREHRPEARFCAGCGGTLATACSSCGTELDADARFCDQCGAPVDGEAASTASPPPPTATAVRKTVTVLFCDLVGSTSFGEHVDPETARETMARYHEMARQAIEANGGTLAKFIGDGVMALFGVPEVGEDDALRAVRTGVELQQRFTPFGDRITQRHGVEVSLRVGINTGELVVADHDDDIVGDVVNTAARLETECVPGRVIVGEDTWRLTRSAVQYEVLGEVSVKGKREPIATFQVVDETSADDEMLTPFVGRDREVEALRAEFELACEEQSARLATVIGAPGVGKTRLSRELGATVGNHGRIFEVRCERAGTATFAPIAELLQAVTDLSDERDLPEILTAIRGVLGDVDDRDRVADLLASAIGAAPGRSTEDTFFGVRRLVEELGRAQPTILVIDDIQWAEPLFLDLLEHLARWVEAPVLIVGLARPELREIRPSLSEVGRRVSSVISLDGLDAAATAQLAAELLGTGELPPELVDRLPTTTDGNPLFVRELVRMLVDDGVIASTDAGWELTVDPEAVDVPPTIQSLLATRVERLPDQERRIIELASVVGSEFPLGALVVLAPELARGDVEDTLERLRRREQIEPTGTYWGDEPVFRFHHVLIRDAAYRRVLKGVRADQHLAVGDWMERTAASIVGDHDVAIAHHFEQAHLYRHQLGTDDTATVEVGRRAAALLGAAARAALERDDLAAAGRLAGRAVGCLPDDDGDLAELFVVGCEASLSSGDVASGAPMLKRLANLAIDDPRLGAWTTCFEAQLTVLTNPGGLTEAATTTASAADTLAELGDDAGVAKARLTRASALARLGRIGDCEAELDLALGAARTADDRRRITSVLAAAPVAALWGPSPVPRAGGRCLDVMRLSRITADSPAVEATSVRCQAVLEGMRGRFDTARSLLDSARATGRKVGLRHGLLETELYAGIIELFADDPVAAEPHLREAFGGLGRLGVGADAGQAAAHLARALLLQGRLDEAEELANDSDALAGQNLQTAIAARSVLAEVLAARGDTDEAIRLADEAVRIAAGTDITLDHANALASLARVRFAAGDAGGARRAAGSARELYEAKGAVVAFDLGNENQGASDRNGSDGPPAPRLDAGAQQADESPELGIADVDTDVVFEDRRKLIGGTYTGITELSGVLKHAARYRQRSTLLYSAGPLLLLSMHAELRADQSAEDEYLLIVRSNLHGKIDLMVAFDQDEHAAAGAEFERLARGTLADDLVLDDRRSMVAHVYVGIGESAPFMEWAQQFAITPVRRYDRSRRLWLGLMDGKARDGSDNEIRWLQVHRYNTDGQLDRMVAFDEDQLRPAIDELNRLDLEMSDGRRRAMLSALYDAVAAGDAKSFEPERILHHPDVVWTDHRHMAINSNGLADIIERNRLLHELIPDLHLFASNVGRIEPPFVAQTIAFRGTTVEGADIDDGYAAAFELDVPTGLWARADLYESTDLDTANRRVAELAADDTRLPRLNDAVYAGGWANAAAYAGHLDRFIDRLHPDFAATLLDGRVVDRQALAAGDVAPIELGFGTADRKLLAIRDERLALVEITDEVDGERRRRFTVDEISSGGLVIAATQFPGGHSDDALVHMDARWLELSGEDELAEIRSRLVRTTTSVRRPDSSDFSALASPDWHAVDHRTLGLLSMDAESRYDVHTVNHEESVSGQASELFHPADVLRISADGWVVANFRRTLNEHGDEFTRTWVAAVEIDPDSDQHRSVHLFDWSDLGSAIARLESLAPSIGERHEPWNNLKNGGLDLDTSNARRRAMLSAMHDGIVGADAKSFEPERFFQRPDVVWTDHRHMAIHSEGLEEVVERNRRLHELIPDLHLFVDTVGRIEPPFMAQTIAYRGTTVEGAEIEDGYAAVFELDVPTGLWARADLYESTDLQTANRRVAELSDADARLPRPNDAAYAGGWANAVAYAGDLDRFIERLHPDFAATVLDGRAVDRAALAAGDITPIDVGLGTAGRKLLAIRDERLALIEITDELDGERRRRFTVEEISDDGLVVGSTQFPADRCSDAQGHMDARWLDLCGDDPLSEMRARFAGNAQLVRDSIVGGVNDLAALDWHSTDHRSLGLGTLDRGGLDAVIEASGGAPHAESLDFIHVDVPLITEAGWLTTITIRTLTVDGDELVQSWLGAVEVDPESDQQRTVHQFEPTDLDAAIAHLESLSSSPSDHEPWNLADRLVNQVYASSWFAHLGDDIVVEDRRATVGTVATGRDGVIEIFGGLDTTQTTVTTIASWRDDLVLVNVVGTGTEFEWNWLAIHQFDDERCVRIVSFDPDDLAAAVEELNRLAMETTDVETLVVNALAGLVTVASSDCNTRRIRQLYAADARWSDRRQIGYGVNDVDDLIERVSANAAVADEFLVRVARELRRDLSSIVGAILIIDTSGTTTKGAQFENSYVTVSLSDAATGLTSATEQFEVDDLAAANARFDEWIAEQTWRPSNDAVLLGGLVNVYARAELLDDALGRLADDFVATMPDGSTTHADDLAAGTTAFGALGFGVAERTVLAVRGNRFALIASVSESDPNDRRLVVHEIDHEAHLARLAVFEPTDLRSALDVLTDWSRPADLSEDTLGVRWERALLDLDAEAVDEMTTDDFVTIDHHPLGLLNVSRDEFLQLRRRADPGGAGFDFAACIHRSSDHGFVTSNSVNSPLSENGTGHEHTLVVGLFRNGKVWRQEVFPQDRLDDAIARYEQHVRDVTGVPCAADHGGPTNRADRLQRSRLDATGEAITMIQTLAVRGDDLALHYVDAGEPRLDVTEWDDDDQLTELVTYSPDQFDDALADLDERYMLRLDSVGAARVALGAHFWRAFRRGNVDEQARSTVISDRRSFGWGSQHTLDDRVQSTEDDLVWTDQIHALGDGIACTSRTTVRGGLGSVLVQRQVSISDHMATSRRTQAEIFDVDDLDVALARRQQLIDERADRPVPPNDAFVVDDTADSVARDLPLDRFLTLLTPDFEATLAGERTIDRADLEAGRATPADLGYGVGIRELFAVRSDETGMIDDIAMIEATRDDGSSFWSVITISDRMISRLSCFDDQYRCHARFSELTDQRQSPDPPKAGQVLRAFAGVLRRFRSRGRDRIARSRVQRGGPPTHRARNARPRPLRRQLAVCDLDGVYANEPSPTNPRRRCIDRLPGTTTETPAPGKSTSTP